MELRMMGMSAVVLLAVTLGVAACDDAGPGDDLLDHVEYESRPAAGTPPPSEGLTFFEARVEGRTISLDLTHAGDHCGIEPAAALTSKDGTILFGLQLTRDASLSACLAWVAETDVHASSVVLPPGRYDVQARVQYPDGLVQYGRAGTVVVE